MEDLKNWVNKVTFNGTHNYHGTLDSKYNKGVNDFSRNYYTEEREYFLMCQGF